MFDPEAVRQGQESRRIAKETPASATFDGSSFSMPNKDLDYESATRMAGPGGAFAIALQNSPELYDRVSNWNNEFAQTREGSDFFGLSDDMGVA